MIVMVCSASNPPAKRRDEATTPSVKAQKTLCQTGGSSWPPEAKVSMTKEPLSELLTKNVITKSKPIMDKKDENGKYSKNLNRAVETLEFTAETSSSLSGD